MDRGSAQRCGVITIKAVSFIYRVTISHGYATGRRGVTWHGDPGVVCGLGSSLAERGNGVRLLVLTWYQKLYSTI